MANYENNGNRWTAIYIKKGDGWEKAPYEIVRFNVDADPDARPFIVPSDESDGKIYERIWKVDETPYKGKVGFNG